MDNRRRYQPLGISPVQPNGAPVPSSSVGLGAQIAPLRDVLRTVKTTFTNPLLSWNGTLAPLPAHYWELQKVGHAQVVVRSSLSNAAGVSHFAKDTVLLDASPDDRWFLALRPRLAKHEEDVMRAVGEVWLDVEAKKWVALEVYPELQKRQMIRFPLWTSVWKAKNGGFVDNLNRDDFATTGTIRTHEMLSPDLPSQWEIEVDANWMKTFIRFEYHDVHQRASASVPPGLCLQAIGRRIDPRTLKTTRGRVGGSAGARRDGTIYMLLERPMADAADVEFGFDNPTDGQTILDLGATMPITGEEVRRLYRTEPRAIDPAREYVLPDSWCSLGMAAKFGRRGDWDSWESLARRRRSDPELLDVFAGGQEPLTFHLDDFILTRYRSGQVSIPVGSRITVFDHRLAFRGRFADRMEPFWDGFLDDSYCRANELYAEAGDGFRETTFVINREGDFFVLRDKRLTGSFGKTKCLGARLAVAGAPEDVVSQLYSATEPHMPTSAELRLFHDAYAGPYASDREGQVLAQHPDAKVCHMLVYVPLRVSGDPVHPAGTVYYIYKALIEAAKQWDQVHPAQETAGGKDYAFVPVTGVSPGDQVVKVRHFFGPRTDGGHQLTILLASRIPELKDRSYVIGRTMHLLSREVNPERPNRGAYGVDAGDGGGAIASVLAHELGHVLGLPDEYAEILDLKDRIPGLDQKALYRFGQRDKAYPFLHDYSAMMNNNMLPRMRYTWSYPRFLNGAARSVLRQPYECVHVGFANGTGLTYRHPGAQGETPWTLFKEGQLKNKLARWFLYRSGDDEATVETMFPRPSSHTAPGDWINGIVVVRIRFWFEFHASSESEFENDRERVQIIGKFGSLVDSQFQNPNRSFYLERVVGSGPHGNANLGRLGIVLQPLFEFGSMPNPRDGIQAPNVHVGDADLVVHVVHGGMIPRQAPPAASIKSVVVNHEDVTLALLRVCLLDASVGGVGGAEVLDPGDFSAVALSVGQAIGESYVVRTVEEV